MVEAQTYLASVIPPSNTFSQDRHCLSDGTAPVLSIQSALPPYSGVTAFTVAAQCDPLLLTPTSSMGSPPLIHDPRLTDHYCESSQSTLLQEPTPPRNPNMYHQQHSWSTSPFELSSHQSETNSPMQATGHLGSSDVISERRTPAPPEPYMGNYGVSDPSISHHGSPYYMSQSPFAHHSTMMVRPSHHPLGLDRSVVLAAPHLHNGHREVMSRRTRLQSPDAIYIKPESALDGSEARSLSVSPSATPGNTSSNRLKKRPAKKSNKKANAREEHLNCYGEEVAPTLKDHCPDEERLIFESRWHFREKRGHDMWNHIQSDFAQKFKRSHGKEMLQMKFRRARSRYILWLRKDEEILRRAWEKVERDRYQSILECFWKMGGSRNMRINASDIEVKVVNDLKLEEGLYLDSHQHAGMGLRRRRKVPLRKRVSGNASGNQEAAESTGFESSQVDHDAVVDQVHQLRDHQGLRASEDDDINAAMWDSEGPTKHDDASPHRPYGHAGGRGNF